MDEIEGEGPIWEVTVIREQTQKVYVQCPTKREAQEAADELVDSCEWEELDTDYICLEIESPPEPYWAGGERGGYVDV